MTRKPELATLLDTVQQAYGEIDNDRHRYLVQEIAAALHALVQRVDLTRTEWVQAIEFLTAVGQECREDRQEFILLSDLLGVSTAVEKVNAPIEANATPTSVQGPFYVPGSCEVPFEGSLIKDHFEDGETALVSGTVTNSDGEPIENAIMEVWQTAPNLLYAVQDENQHEDNLRGFQRTNKQGQYAFHTLKPVPYLVPTDGPCGKLLRASKRHGYRTAHLHFKITAPGFKMLVTQIYPTDDPYLDSDTVFAVEKDLTVEFVKAADNASTDLVANYDFVMSKSEPS